MLLITPIKPKLMENILDEQLEENEILKPIPLVIYLLMAALFIFFIGNISFAQSLPYAMLIQNIGAVSVLIIGVSSIKLLKEKKDVQMNFYLGLFLFSSFSKIAARFMDYEHPLRLLLSVGERFFLLAILLVLMRYFVLERPQKTILNVLKYPVLVSIPMWIIGTILRTLSWPFGSEVLVLSVLFFFLGSVLMLILKLKEGQPRIRIINFCLVLMVNLFIFGVLFKMQSWPYASELLNFSFIGGTLALVLKLMQNDKLQKKQAKELEA